MNNKIISKNLHTIVNQKGLRTFILLLIIFTILAFLVIIMLPEGLKALGYILYMWMPLLAVVVNSKLSKEPLPKLFDVDKEIRSYSIMRFSATAIIASLALVIAMTVALLIFGNALHIPYVGKLALTSEEITYQMRELLQLETIPPAPPLSILFIITVFGGIIAGFTVNGLAAFGEEYAWRGYLFEHFRNYHSLSRILFTGILWGLWHAPIILTGYNYGVKHIGGVLAMIILCVGMAVLFDQVRVIGKSVLAPTVLHGFFNAVAGLLVYANIGGSKFVSVPMGILGAITYIAVAIGFPSLWNIFTGKKKKIILFPDTSIN